VPDVERALISTALAKDGGILELVSRGVEPEAFPSTESGKQCAAVLRFAIDYTRRYGQQPSLGAVQRQIPDWHGDFSPDPLAALADEHLDCVRRRHFDSIVLRLATDYKDPSHRRNLDAVLLDAAREMAAAVPSGRVERFSADLQRRADEYEAQHGAHRPGTPLGIPVIDDVMYGIRPGWLVTYAGYSGLGKSLLSSRSLLAAFEEDKTALMLSLEMSAREVLERLDTMVMHWRQDDYIRGKLTDLQRQEWRDVARVYSKARGEIVVVDRLSGCTIDRVHAEIERYKPDVCAIDYVQRMRASYNSRRPRYEQLEEITNELKSIAMDTDTGIIMVSQDGRDAAQSGSTSSNMGGSISVYQAADAYIGMMQDEQMRAMRKMRIKLLKIRYGSPAEVDVLWDPARGDLCRKWEESMAFVAPEAPL
jgi:replicative DNA helicase